MIRDFESQYKNLENQNYYNKEINEKMNKRQAKKERDKLITVGRTYKGTRLKKRHDKKIWGMLKKKFDNCEKLRSLTLYNQRKKNQKISH